jgi:hypothetical protein
MVADIIPMDTRFLSYDLGTNEIPRAAYKTNRSKSLIYEDYKVEVGSETAEVLDCWDTEKEYVFVEGKQVKEERHGYNCVPIVITKVPTGSLIADSEAYKHRGESIYWQNRDLYEQMNKVVSVFSTVNIRSFRTGLQLASDAGAEAARPDVPPIGTDFVVPVEKGGGYMPMPLTDIKAASKLLYSILETRIQRGSLSSLDFGNLTFPLSAVAIARLTNSRNRILLPRLQALAIHRQLLSRMIIKQYSENGLRFKDYTGSELTRHEYTIGFTFTVTSPEQNIANYSIANAARPFVSGETIRRDVIRLDDPTEEENKILSELADGLVPELQMYKMAKAKIEEGKDVEAQLIANRLGVSLEQLKSGKMETAPKAKERNAIPKSEIPLLGGVKGGSSRYAPGSESVEAAEATETAEEIEGVGVEI